ncbi:hypothetical protein [uncultured Gilliamella sp.]|uniref:hypothetical protein n=1 Tax=uncultured Gilliamella sp. TaxID=1193505 RepID=UPI0025D16B22|nr:hypothetical protein [uncultured Gilliamella sp.]
MSIKKIYVYFIIYFFLLINYGYANEAKQTWYFYKVSKSTAYGETAETRDNLLQKRENLIEQFANTIIVLTNNNLKIDNQCSLQYSIKFITPKTYWNSIEKSKLYKNLFIKEKSPLNQKMDVITYSKANINKSCPKNLNNLIKNSDYLIATTEEGYLIFFSKQADKKQLSSQYKGQHHPINLLGHPMIKDKSIIDLINKQCNFFADEDKSLKYGECITDELSLFYARILEKIENNKIEIYQDGQYKYYLASPKISKENLSNEYRLFIEKDNNVIDSLTLYGFDSCESSITYRYYYIDEKLKNIWLLEVSSFENSPLVEKGTYYETSVVDYWKHYQIDEGKHFKLIESLECNYKFESVNSDAPTSWQCN